MTLAIPLLGLLLLSSVMALAWRWQLYSRNAGPVDVLWTAGIGGLTIAYAVLGDGWGQRRLLVGVLVGVWSARLAWHLAARVMSEPEDGRYAILRERWGDRFDPWMFWFFQAQALLAVLLSLVFFVLCSAPNSGWSVWDGVALTLWVGALIGEAVADRQLSSWRSDAQNAGRTCRSGLWRYSRHPNYFFEWLTWVAYALLGIGLPFGYALWLAPLVMLWLIRSVTGIPPTEEQAVRRRGADYRDYQRTTNAFFPGPQRIRQTGAKSGPVEAS